MGKLRKLVLFLNVSSALVLFIFGIYLLNSINHYDKKLNSNFSKFLKLDEYKPLEEPINVLLTGADVALKPGDPVRTDTIMVVNYNPKNSQVNILSIPRDTRIKYKGRQEKINAVYQSAGMDDDGCKALKETISNLIGVHIDYYVLIKTDVFRAVINELDGIDYNVPCDLFYNDPEQNLKINIKKGQQHLNGSDAEGIMRFRHPQRNLYPSYEDYNEVSKYYDGSDLKRIDVQQSFIKEVIKQKASLSSLSKVQEILGIVFNKLITDFKLDTTIKIGANIGNLSQDKVKNFKIAVKDVGNDVAYINMITDNTTKENYPGEEIIQKYFNTGEEFTPSETQNVSTEEVTAEPTLKPTLRPIITTNKIITPVVTKTNPPTILPTAVPTATATKIPWTPPPKTIKPTIPNPTTMNPTITP